MKMNQLDAKNQNDDQIIAKIGDPIIENFKISNFFGNDLEITCKKNAHIFTAYNGTGKSSLLTCLYNVLQNPEEVHRTKFDSIHLNIDGQEINRPVRLYREFRRHVELHEEKLTEHAIIYIPSDLDVNSSVNMSVILDNQKMEQIVNIVNIYLEDSSKKLLIRGERVFFRNEFGIISSLDNLSSSEKRVFHMIYTAYMNDDKFIMLIDDPETSLSIMWQELILQHIFLAPNCVQLIAMSNSPFVFDNALNKYAQTMDVTKNKNIKTS